MRFSHSRVETFESCPMKFKLRYIDEIETLPNTDDPANPLVIGTAMHEGIEKGVEEGIRSYINSYPVLTDGMINEIIKLEHWIPKVREMVEMMAGYPIFERPISTSNFVGFIDLLVPVGRGVYDLWDFKYSNNVDRYMVSRQLHEYKYQYEKSHPTHKIRNIGFIFIPKTAIRQKKTEDLYQFRNRLKETLEGMEIQKINLIYNPDKVKEFFRIVEEIKSTKEFPKNETKLCDWCDYKLYCQQGVDFMLLPKNERRVINAASRKKIWLYGAPFSGKTTLADNFPNPIMLNTDGNINSFTAPMVEVKETLEGRQRISAWENLKDTIDELQKGSDFETIVVDLVEDCYEHCRRWCYEQLGITHESDNSFKAYDFVRSEFLTVFKRLMTLDYNIVLISHEDMSKDIMKKSGDKITSIRPNIADKVANKLAGMVDIVARVVADGNDRTLQFKSDDVVFGGGRLKLTETVIPLTYEALEGVYKAQGKPVETKKIEAPKAPVEEVPDAPVKDDTPWEEPTEEPKAEEAPRRRRRRTE